MEKIGLVRDPLFLLHENGPGHPESPARLSAIDAMLERCEARRRFVEVPARDATLEELGWVHSPAYLSRIAATRGVPHTVLDPDTSANERSWEAANRAAGGVICAVEAVASGSCTSAVALVRPPGHHAEHDRAMGFCLVNNVAVAAEFARRRRGRQRVLIVDWDVHHGNGTMQSFYDTDRVLFFSVHQYPHYPGSGRIDEVGRGNGEGFTVNVPLPPGQGDVEYAEVFERVLEPIAREYRPDLILVSAGFDIAQGDPLASMSVTDAGFAGMTRSLRRLAAECCPGQLVFTLEGGYDLGALAHGLDAVLGALASDDAGEAARGRGSPSEDAASVIALTRRTLGRYWPSLGHA